MLLREAVATVLVVTSLWGAAGATSKKGTLPPQALWDGAKLIVGGTIHNLRPAEGPYLLGTLRPAILFRGALSGQALEIRLYGPTEVENRCAIWFLRRTGDGFLTEEYPWVRQGPESFLVWPAELRDRILGRLAHTRSRAVAGLSLYLIRAPTAEGDPITAWVAVIGEPGSAAASTARVSIVSADLTVVFPDRTVRTWELLVSEGALGRTEYGSVRMLDIPATKMPQAVILSATRWAGHYALTAKVHLSPPEVGMIETALEFEE